MAASPIRFIPLVFIAPFLLLTACDDGRSGQAKALRDEVEQLTKHHYEAQQAAKRLQSQLDAAKKETTRLEDAVKKAEDEHEGTKKELEQIRKDFETYKSKYKVSVRNQVPGLRIADFAALGKSYEKVVATQFTDELIAFNHSAGTGKVRIVDLPDVVRDVLGLTEVHQVIYREPVEDARPLSKSKQQELKKRAIEAELHEVDKQMRAMRDELYATQREIGSASQELSRLKYQNRETFQQERVVAALELRKNQIQSELLRLDVVRHEVGLKRSSHD
jgi:septal ring factor EnvC (AmiA/AmiB activator)